MKKLFVILFLLIIISPFVYTQTVDGQFVVMSNDGTNYSVKVQIKLQSGAQNLGNSTIRFSFDNTNLSFPASPVEGIDYVFRNFQGGDYLSSVSRPNLNTVSINIGIISGSGTSVNANLIDVATINFTTQNSSGNSNLQWGLRELYIVGAINPLNLGSWPNLDTSPLPVELSSFTASSKQDKVELKWQTTSEVNNYGFEIERKIGSRQSSVGNSIGTSYEKIGFVNGSGNSNLTKEYSFLDKNPTGGSKFQYRLKQIDNDGQFEYSDVVEVEVVPTKFELSQNYPNPFNPTTKISYTLPVDSKVSIKIYDILGNLVETLVDEQMEAGYYNINFNAISISSGIYFYRIETGNFVETKKMLLLK